MVVSRSVNCDKCLKPCQGDAVLADEKYFHQECFNCRVCGNDLFKKGFYHHEAELYCGEDYHHMFGSKCNGCGKYTEGESVTVGDEIYHEQCFCCASCRVPFPPSVNVNYDGSVYMCDNCYSQVGVGDHNQSKTDSKCAGCSNEIKTGQALLALDKQWHLWCFTCHKCGCLLAGEYMGRDGVPYCEQDYQAEFGVSCAGCGGYITGKVLQAGEKHYHPRCSRCAKCGQMFGEGEEMYLQGSEIWHPHCNDEYQREIEENEAMELKAAAAAAASSPQSDQRYSTSQYSERTTTTHETKTSHSASGRTTESVNIHSATKPINGDARSASAAPAENRITSAYAAKPFGAPKTSATSVSMKFANATQQRATPPYEEKPAQSSPDPYDYNSSGSGQQHQQHRSEVTTKTTSYHQAAPPRDVAPHSGSDDGGPPPPPPPTRSTSRQWQSRYSSAGAGPPSVAAKPPGQSTVTKTETTVTYRSGGAYNDDRPNIGSQGRAKSYDPGQQKSYEITKQTTVSNNSYGDSQDSDSGVPSFLRRGRSDDSRDTKAFNRRSLPAPAAQNSVSIEVKSRSTAQDDINLSNQRNTLSISSDGSSGAFPIYTYEEIKTTNFKIPKEVDRSRLEEYLSDEEFEKILKMKRDAFYKLAMWKQKDLKRRSHLF